MDHSLSICELFLVISPTTKQYKALEPQTINRIKSVSFCVFEKDIGLKTSPKTLKVITVITIMIDSIVFFIAILEHYSKSNIDCEYRKNIS